MTKQSLGDRLRISQTMTLSLLARLSPRVYGFVRRGKIGRAARKILDVLVPPGSDVVSTVRAGPLRGTMLRLDPRKQKEMLLGTYETGVQRALQQHAGPGDTVFDVGAHVGFFSLLASKVVGDEGRVVAFEPDPFMSERLSTNLTLNGRPNVTWRKAAVGERRAQMTFAPGQGGGIGRLSNDGSLTVEVVTLDDEAEELGPPAVIKVDVEGGELGVLSGGMTVLTKHHPVLIVEAHGEENETRAAEMLSELGYNIEYINDLSGRRHLLATSSE